MIFQALSSVLAIFSLLLGSLLHGSNAPAPSQSQSFRISGTVVDALGGQPLARAQVSITSQALPDSTQAVTTGEDGRFSFENLPAGHYQLSARRKGYIQQGYKQHESFATAIVTGADLNTGDLRFELRPSASISGQVLDEMNEPVRGAQVMLLRQGLRFGQRQTWRARQAITDDQGHYHLGHLIPGTCFISVLAQPWYAQHVPRQPVRRSDPNSGQTVDEQVTAGSEALDVAYPLTFFSNATDITGASPITLRPGDAEIADITLRPVPAVHLSFRSSSADESERFSVRQITMQVADGVQQNLPVGTTTRGGSGITEVTGLPPGRLNLSWTSSKGNESTTHSQTVQLGSDLEIGASDAPPSPAVTGVIQMDDGSPPPRSAFLRIHNAATGATLTTQPQPNGDFTFEGQGIAAGTYDVMLLQPSSTVRSISATGAKVSGHTVEIGSAQDVRLTVLVSKGSGSVTGFALKDGKPVDGVLIVLVPQDPEHNLELFRRDQSDSDGSFNLSGILAGKYTVVAIEDAWSLEWSNPSVLQKYLAGGQTLQVTANAKLELKVNVQQ